jgi:hypothetical protein
MASLLLAQKTNVGGHVKMSLIDYKDGESDGDKGSEYAGAALREFLVYISQEITDKVSIETITKFSARTSATPSFGKTINDKRNLPRDVTKSFGGWRKFVVKLALPKGYELSTGILHPNWSWDYGGEKFWDEEINGNKFSLHHDISSLHEAGLEIYKNFELSGISLPAYLWIVNGGSEFNDNNKSVDIGLKVEPEIGPAKFEAGIMTGKYDNDGEKSHMRWIAGIDYTWKKLNIRSEIAGGKINEKIAVKDTSGAIARYDDTNPFGFYVKAFYQLTPWLKAMLAYDYVKNDYGSSSPGEEIYSTITPGLQISVGPSSQLIVQGTIADWKRIKDAALLSSAAAKKYILKFSRILIGWRITF